MRCHGGKTKVGKQITMELIKILNEKNDLESYIETFCGMCGVLYRLCQIYKVNELLDKEIVNMTGAYTTLEKIRKCKYSTNSNQDVECLYVIDNRIAK